MARPGDNDDLPWLAEGVREERSTLVPRARLFGGSLLAVGVAVLIGLGVYLASGHKSDGSSGYAKPEDAPLIAADTGPYKVAPDNPGGAQITGIDDTIAATASGDNPGSAIAADTPEEPIARAQLGAPLAAPTAPPTDLLPATIPPAAAPAPLPSRPIAAAPVVAPPPKAETAKADAIKPVPPKPKSAAATDPLAPLVKVDTAARAARFDPVDTPTTAIKPVPARAARGGVSLQLGAFSTRDKAEAAWLKAGGDGALAGLGKRIEAIDRDGTTLYRLRAGGVASKASATALCGRIKSAGNACIVAE